MRQKFEFDYSNEDILRNIIHQIVHIANPDKIILFGSRATGKAKKDSDYDVLVLKKYGKRKRLINKIYMNLSVGAPVDVLVSTPKRFDEMKDKWYYVHSDIAKEGKIIYER